MITPEELKERTYKLAVVDFDSILYKSAAAGTITTYTLYNEDGEHVGSASKSKDIDEMLKQNEEFFGLDCSGWTKEKTVEHQEVEHCYRLVDTFIRGLQKQVKADKWRFFIGRGELERDNIATILKYKGNRTNVEKPYHFDAVKDYVESLPETTVVRNLEVDDVVSVMLCNDFYKNGENPERILLYPDKDLENSMGAHYHIDKDEFSWITEQEADFNFACQMLSGDKQVDNIQGLPDISDEFRERFSLPKRKGVGKVTAKKILEDLEGQPLQTLYNRVLEAYKSYYGDSEHVYKAWTGEEMSKTAEAILDENASLLFMMRKKDESWEEYKKRTFK